MGQDGRGRVKVSAWCTLTLVYKQMMSLWILICAISLYCCFQDKNALHMTSSLPHCWKHKQLSIQCMGWMIAVQVCDWISAGCRM